MNNLESVKMARIFNGQRKKSYQGPRPEPTVKRNPYTGFMATMSRVQEQNSAIEGDVKKLTEGTDKLIVNEMVSKEQVRAWLDRAQSVISERSDQIHTTEEKEKFLTLSSVIKNFTPVAEASDEDVMRSLNNLKQNIKVEENDSDHLSSVKRHLVAEIEKMLT
jgi:hypothetical protein